MIKFIVLYFAFFISELHVFAHTIKVKNADELHAANKMAKPGDIIQLQNGEWKNVQLVLDCLGSKTLPIIFKAETAGKVFIIGKSTLSIGGSYIVIDGLHFTKGYAGSNAVITFRTTPDKVANYCTLVNTVIDDFNNPKRLEENYWIELYGKHNSISHCSFLNKKNIGVLMAVILNNEKSQENFHSIDHNYFGVRIPLASNGGEIIRVGVSQQCEFNSNTQITDNFFENCDGETEIISLKSGSNVVRNNLFKECQGAVVLRHGNFNTVENNIFLGNDKEGTGGVRIINKGQWVVNNLFYKCRGEGFRSPLAIMNGIPNSPAFRYVAVSDAVIYGNTFFECAPISFCEGSDTERTLAPKNTLIVNNIFYNSDSSSFYKIHDNIDGIFFVNNLANIEAKNANDMAQEHVFNMERKPYPDAVVTSNTGLADSLKRLSFKRLSRGFSNTVGFNGYGLLDNVLTNANDSCGANFTRTDIKDTHTTKKYFCADANEMVAALADDTKQQKQIILTKRAYNITEAISVKNNCTITTKLKEKIILNFSSASNPFCFVVESKAALRFMNIQFDLQNIKSNSFISTDTSAPSNHLNFSMDKCKIENYTGNFFYAVKSSVCDSIIIHNSTFNNCTGSLFNLAQETDKKGYYPVEKMTISNCLFENNDGEILNILRGGNDESTMGPLLTFNDNQIISSTNNFSAAALINLHGVQKSFFTNNSFTNSDGGKSLIRYTDEVRANHILQNNKFISSGTIEKNKYVVEPN